MDLHYEIRNNIEVKIGDAWIDIHNNFLLYDIDHRFSDRTLIVSLKAVDDERNSIIQFIFHNVSSLSMEIDCRVAIDQCGITEIVFSDSVKNYVEYGYVESPRRSAEDLMIMGLDVGYVAIAAEYSKIMA